MKKIIALGLGIGFAPLLVFAAVNTVGGIIVQLLGFLSYVVPALVTIAVIYFIWGVISFIMASDEEAKKMGKTKIINGLIGLFVIVAFWGIIAIVKNTFSVGNATGDSIIPLTPLTNDEDSRGTFYGD